MLGPTMLEPEEADDDVSWLLHGRGGVWRRQAIANAEAMHALLARVKWSGGGLLHSGG